MFRAAVHVGVFDIIWAAMPLSALLLTPGHDKQLRQLRRPCTSRPKPDTWCIHENNRLELRLWLAIVVRRFHKLP